MAWSTQKLLGTVAGVLGILQGLAWTCMCLAALITYGRYHLYTLKKDTYAVLLNSILYAHYLDGSDDVGPFRIIKPEGVLFLMLIYISLSTAFALISVELLFSIHLNRLRQCYSMILWGTITVCNSIVDFVVASILLRDFTHCPQPASWAYDLTLVLLCHTAIGIAMTIAARGFTLWLVNVSLACFLLSSGVHLRKIRQTPLLRVNFNNHARVASIGVNSDSNVNHRHQDLEDVT